MSPINRLECQQWMIKAYAKCRDLLGSNAPNDNDTPAFYKDVDLLTPEDCYKLKRKLDWEREAPELASLVKVTAILSVAVIVVLLIIFVCGVKWRSRTTTDSIAQQPVQQECPPETPRDKRKKKFNFKKWIRGRFRSCMVQSEEQARRHQLKTQKRVDVHKEHSQRKLDEWNKAREKNAQRKMEKLERRKAKEYDRMQKRIPSG